VQDRSEAQAEIDDRGAERLRSKKSTLKVESVEKPPLT
jgi:hypothetical protein